MHQYNRRDQRLTQVTESNIIDLMASVDYVLMGLGGVYWLDPKIFPGSGNLVEELQNMGLQIIYLTNNDMHTRDHILNQLINLGIKNVKMNEICSVSHATGVYLKRHLKIDQVYCFGPPALVEELKNNNIEVLTAHCDNKDGKSLENFLVENKIGTIVMGLDVNFGYQKARALSNYMLKHDVLYIATNMQNNYVRRNIRLMPGVKAQAKMIKELSGRKPDYVIGKPEEPIFRVLMSQIVIDLSRTLLIGHRLETDILFAYKCRVTSSLVLSEMATLADATDAEFSDKLIERASCPDYFVENIQELQRLLHFQDQYELLIKKISLLNLLPDGNEDINLEKIQGLLFDNKNKKNEDEDEEGIDIDTQQFILRKVSQPSARILKLKSLSILAHASISGLALKTEVAKRLSSSVHSRGKHEVTNDFNAKGTYKSSQTMPDKELFPHYKKNTKYLKSALITDAANNNGQHPELKDGKP